MEFDCLVLEDLSHPRKGFKLKSGNQSEEKENLCTVKWRVSPGNPAESSIPVFLTNQNASTSDVSQITPIKHTTPPEPWTPTANLKVLISAASPDIRHREMRKVLFRQIENDENMLASPGELCEEAEDFCQPEAVNEEDDPEKKPSRKQKSLGLLCQKFLALYPDYPSLHCPILISLDEVATSLSVERRRIYDIVNVLEALSIVGRLAKNSYTWFGRQRLMETLADLQKKAREQGYHLQVDSAVNTWKAGEGRDEDGADGDPRNAAMNRKDKSLRIMSQKFVMLFLVSKTQTVTLDAAAKILIEECQDPLSLSKYKTKVRRLYDIANVLTSLGLIKKLHVMEERARKPAFRWLGPVEFGRKGNTVTATSPPESGQDAQKGKLARHMSFDMKPMSVAMPRLVKSAPSSPRCSQAGLSTDYSRTIGNVGVERQADLNHNRQQSQSSLSSILPAHPKPVVISPPHCLAYLPSLSQPSVVMLYKIPDNPSSTSESQRSSSVESGKVKKRTNEENDENETAEKKMRIPSGLEGSDKKVSNQHTQTQEEECSWMRSRKQMESNVGNGSSDSIQPGHYLYVPNTAGMNNLNFMIPGEQTPAGVPFPPGGVHAVALPYVLVPSVAFSQYPQLAGNLQPATDNSNKFNFGLPAVLSPSIIMGATPNSMSAAQEISKLQIPSQVTPEQSTVHLPGTSTVLSPSQPRHTVSIEASEPKTPHTPKETMITSSKAFFETPGTLESVAVPPRKRGSAQRRLDISHPGAN